MGRPSLDLERREQIMTAFEACVIEYGLHKTTLQKVADQAGLPRPLVRHFVGNKDQMVGLLLDRMVERADHDMAEKYAKQPDLNEMLDFLFAGAFRNPISNQLIDQLWQLAYHDEKVKQQLNDLYGLLKSRLMEQMRVAQLPKPERFHDIAQTLVSLAYGESCFAEIGMATNSKQFSRQLADQIIQSLKEEES